MSIVIASMPLSVSLSVALSEVKTEEELVGSILGYKQRNLAKDEEVLFRRGNLLATTKKYYLALYSEDLNLVRKADCTCIIKEDDSTLELNPDCPLHGSKLPREG